ncbi:MAG: hypothetical protein JSS65_06535 [Armatimonadetes bacterium]|nr:hypothetical protein [Armatimonadota bacterium]
MRPLLFLVSRTFVNGIVRSFSSPSRALGTIFFIAMQLWWLGNSLTRAVMGGSQFTRLPAGMPRGSLDLVEAITFGFFALSSWIWGLGMFTAPFGFQKADSDCLFPTPVNNRHILSLHLVRNTLFKLLMPLISSAILYRPVRALGDEVASGTVSSEAVLAIFRAAVFTYFLLMTFWTLARYASVLATAGTETNRMRLRFWMLVSSYVVSLVSLVGYFGMVYLHSQQVGGSWQGVASGMADQRLWWWQPIGGLAAITALGPSHQDWMNSALALLGLAGVTALCLHTCFRYSGYLCEVGLQSIDSYERYRRNRSRSYTDQVAERARSGGVKGSVPAWLEKWNQVGERAFIWREAVIQWRTNRLGTIFMTLSVGALCAFTGKLDLKFVHSFPIPLLMVLIGATGSSNLAQTGVRDFLRRNDLIRPLPLATSKLLRLEATGRTTLVLLPVVVGSIAWAIVDPGSLYLFPFTVFFGLGASFALVGGMTLTTILLPDIEDPTQRSFRQLVQGLSMMLCLAILGGSYIGLVFVTAGLWIPSLVSGALGIGLGLAFLALSDSAYKGYVPND